MAKPSPKPFGKSAVPTKANPMAAARSHGQQGAAMKAAHAAPPKVGLPVMRPPKAPMRGGKRK